MDWFTKRVDTVVIVGAIASSLICVNGRFNAIDSRFSKIEQDLAVVKAVLIMNRAQEIRTIF